MANFFKYRENDGKGAAINLDLIRQVAYNPNMKFIVVHFDANHTIDFSGTAAEALFQALGGGKGDDANLPTAETT
jgi:hypothetical protein